jgi:hypothetical protein
MKMQNVKKFLAFAALCLVATSVQAQTSPTSATIATAPPATAQPAPASQAAPQLSYGVSEVLQLATANVGEDVIVNYIHNSANGYSLDANQIVYLKQQGISDRIINAMLTQPKSPVAASTSTSTAVIPTATVAPTVTYVQTVPTTYYYDQPYYYPDSAWYPPVTLSFGWGFGGRGWGGGHGGWRR